MFVCTFSSFLSTSICSLCNDVLTSGHFSPTGITEMEDIRIGEKEHSFISFPALPPPLLLPPYAYSFCALRKSSWKGSNANQNRETTGLALGKKQAKEKGKSPVSFSHTYTFLLQPLSNPLCTHSRLLAICQ